MAFLLQQFRGRGETFRMISKEGPPRPTYMNNEVQKCNKKSSYIYAYVHVCDICERYVYDRQFRLKY